MARRKLLTDASIEALKPRAKNGRDLYIIARSLYEFIKVEQAKSVKEGRRWSDEQDAKMLLVHGFGSLYPVFVAEDQRRGVTPADLVDEKLHSVDNVDGEAERQGDELLDEITKAAPLDNNIAKAAGEGDELFRKLNKPNGAAEL